MLCLKVASPEYFVIEFVIVFLQKFNCFCISHMTKLRIHYMVQAIQKSFVDKGIEEVHLLRSILQHITDHVFQHVLCKIHIVIQIGKCTFRLDHPELSSMTRCIGVLRTESRSECINITECLCISLTVQLTTYCKISLFAEEILTVIYSTVFIQRRILHIQCSNLEHLSRTLAVTSCDQRCVYIYETSFLEEFVDRVCTKGTYTKYRLESVCSRSQMCHGSQVFQSMTFLLKRIIRCRCAFYLYFISLNFKRLFCFRCRNQSSPDDNSSAYIQLADFGKIRHIVVIYNLQCLKKSTIMKYDKTKCLGTTYASYPSSYSYFPIQVFFSVFINFFYSCELHNLYLSVFILIQLLSSIDYSLDYCKE